MVLHMLLYYYYTHDYTSKSPGYADVTVSLEMSSYTVQEGEDDVLEVCVVITYVPEDGLECDIVIYLDTWDGTASMYYIS